MSGVQTGKTRAIWEPIPNSPQVEFMSRTDDEVLFGGAAGGAKTESLLHYPVRDLLRIPKLQALYIQRENNRMRDVLVRAQEFFIPLGATYNKTEQTFTFPNGSRYEFGHMEHEESKVRYQGRAFEIICFDELTQFTESQYLYLFSRNRGAFNPQYRAKMRAATNPGGIGHGWVRSRFVDALVPGRTRFFVRINNEDRRCHPDTPFAKSRAFIPSRVTDNPYYRNTAYVANLMALPENERRALLEGDWNAFEGQFFRMWRRNIHVVEPFELPKDWAYFGAYDYGHSSPACYLLAGINREGDVYFVRELYKEELSIREQAEAIIELESGIKVSGRIADNQIFEHRMKNEPGSDDTIDQIFYRESGGRVSFGRSNKERMSGWAAMKEYMAWDGNYDGTLASLTRRPQFYVTANCTNLIREIEGAVYSQLGNAQSIMNKKSRIEDLDTRGSDHALDPARYLIQYVYAPRPVKPRQITVREMFLEQGKPRPPKGVMKF